MSSRSARSNDAPDISHVKGVYGSRQFVCQMRTQKNASGASMRVGTPITDDDGESFVYAIVRNAGRDPDSRQPEYQLGKAIRDESGRYGQLVKVAGLWAQEFNVGNAEPARGLSGQTNDKATRYTLLLAQELPDGGRGAALFLAVRGDAEIEASDEPDEFLDD